MHLPNRENFSPDAAFYVGPDPGMKFYEGAPVFAVEVRSEGDYGPAAEEALAAKRADYFAAGGFDPALARAEDTELGLRLEQIGVEIGFSRSAYSINGSDHSNLESWRRTAQKLSCSRAD